MSFIFFISLTPLHVYIFTLTLFGILKSLDGLQNVEIEAPSYIRQGEDIVFRCHYDLENDLLYVVKWYKGQEEFYRYVPKEVPPQKVFPLPHGGIDVDIHFSNAHEVFLKNMTLDLSGLYKCVVSAESPFQTVERVKEVGVVGIGYEMPRMSLDLNNYHPGDVIRANCSLEKTFPVPNVTWFINDRETKFYGIESHVTSRVEMGLQNMSPLATMVSTITFTLPESFLPTSLHCRVQLFDLYDESVIMKIQPIPRRYSLRSNSSFGGGNNITIDVKVNQKVSTNAARGSSSESVLVLHVYTVTVKLLFIISIVIK